jgi:hypothetical protein
MSTDTEDRPAPALKGPHKLAAPVRRGIVVWFVIGLVLAIPETIGSNIDSWFYSISRSVGHMELLWGGTRAVVVALIAVAAVHALLFRNRTDSLFRGRKDAVQRGDFGHLVRSERFNRTAQDATGLWWVLVIAAVGIAVAGFLVPFTKADPYTRGYVIYGSITVLFYIVPNVYAYRTGKAAFSTLFETVNKLERLKPFVMMIVIAGLAVLIFHLALYPWPSLALTQG